MDPLGREETEEYIAHRIRVAGGDGMLIFDSAAVDGIYEYSQGIPRLINILCSKALLMAYLNRMGLGVRGYVDMPMPEPGVPEVPGELPHDDIE